jgi:hypothetical protein
VDLSDVLKPRPCQCGGRPGCEACGGTGEIPVLFIKAERIMCGRHGEPFREAWPAGYPTFVMTALKNVCSGEAFTTALESGGVEALGRLLDEKPACCRMRPEDLVLAYHLCQQTAQPWCFDACCVCGENHVGCRYQYRSTGGGVRVLAHVCFGCIVYRLRTE